MSKKLNLNEMIQFVLDKANHPSGDRRMENIVKTAINTAYMNFARVDCDIGEFEIPPPISMITILPDDFLTALQLFHDSLGSLNDYQYRVSNGSLVVAKHIATYDDVSGMTLIYGKKPELLEDENDEPEINEEYHMALCYYALTEITEDPSYRYKYEDILRSVPLFEPIINNNLVTEYVINDR